MRGKIIIPNFIAVLLLGIGTFLFLRVNLQNKAEERLTERMKTVGALYVRSEALHGFELLTSVRQEALSKTMVQAFAPVEIAPEEGLSREEMDARVRRKWFSKANNAIRQYNDNWQRERNERPDLVVLTDRTGVVIARNISPNACPTGFKMSESVRIVDRSLDGEASYSIWSVDDSPFSSKKRNKDFCQLMNAGLLELAAAPVWYGDDIAGVLVIGFEISNGTAQKRAKALGLDVAVLKGGDVYSSSFKTDTERQSLDQQLDAPNVVSLIEKSVTENRQSKIFEISVEGAPYYAMSLPSAHAEAKDKVTTLILGSQEKETEYLTALSFVLVFMGIALIVVFAVGMVLTNHFMTPVMAIEEGILKVINGEYDYRFDVESSEVGGLSYRINQLIGALTGEEEDNDDE